MIAQFRSKVKDIVKMSIDERKNKLADLKVIQILREQHLKTDTLEPFEELEAMILLQSMVSIDNAIEQIIQLRKEIDQLAEEKINAMKKE
jgi:hypothetical protein